MQYTALPTLADAIFPGIDSESRALVWARNIVLMLGGMALVALCAQIQVRLPWTTVPITMQTFKSARIPTTVGARFITTKTTIGLAQTQRRGARLCALLHFSNPERNPR